MTLQRPFRLLPPLAGAAVLVLITAGDARSQWAARGGHVVVPNSSIEQEGHIGFQAHTNLKLLVPAAGKAARQDSPEAAPEISGPPFSGYFFETPASLGCIYKLVSGPAAGCDPNSVTVNPAAVVVPLLSSTPTTTPRR